MKTYRIGIVGFGFIGKVHAYGYLNFPLFYDPLPFRTRITHVCTSRMETAEKGAAQIGAEVATTDFREITENPDIDVVNLCSPNDAHLEQLLSAMKRQKHIFCDKPLVVDMAEAEKIEAARGDYRGTLQMTMQLRFFPAMIRARQLINDGFLGKPLQFRVIFLHSGSADPNAPMKWKLSGARGGGVIADLGSHVLDVVHYALGEFTELNASVHTAYPERPSIDDPSKKIPVDAEDAMFVQARMKNGAVGVVEATKLATGSEDEMRMEIHGSKGAIRFNSMDPHHLEIYDATVPASPIGGVRGWTRVDTGQRYPAPAGFPGGKVSIGWIRSHMACLYNFMRDVHEGKPGNPGLDAGLYVQKLMERTRESARSKQWVAV